MMPLFVVHIGTHHTKIFSILFLATVITNSFSQSDTLLFKYRKKGHLNYMTCVDTLAYLGYGGVIPKNSYVYVNDRVVSGAKEQIPQSRFILNKDKVYFIGYSKKNETKSLCHFQKSGFAKDCEFANNQYLALNTDSVYMNIENKTYSIIYGKCTESSKIRADGNTDVNKELVDIQTLPDGTHMFVFGIMEQGYTDFLYVIKNRQHTKVIHAKHDFKDPNFILEIPFVNEQSKVYYGKTMRTDMSKNKKINNDVLLDKEFKIYTTVLKKSNLRTEHVLGYNYYNQKLYSYNIASKTDDGIESVIAYKFVPELELAMRKVYLDSLITEKELNGFGYYELQCLSNILLAKHNFAFASKYFQSYFNLFNFYNDPAKRKSRNASVDQMLTQNDKLNLKMFRKRIQPYEIQYKNFKIE